MEKSLRVSSLKVPPIYLPEMIFQDYENSKLIGTFCRSKQVSLYLTQLAILFHHYKADSLPY
jgi:hypothetical protein